MTSEAALDNVVWASLMEARAETVERNAGGARYRPAFAPFGAARDYDADSVAQIVAMLKEGERLALFTMNPPEVPAHVDVVRKATVHQMIATNAFNAPADARIVELSADDVPDMLKLVALTEPGPFSTRTHELGHFYCVRDAGRLVAMAGERMTAGRYIETSAVCVHPEWRGKGLAKVLMQHLGAKMQERGSIPFLHVFDTNASAIRLYRELGFSVARTLHLTAMIRA